MTKIKYTCGSITPATCVKYETNLPTFSEIENCPSIEETTAEIYTLIGQIKADLDLTELGEDCLTYTQVGGKIPVKNVLLKIEEKVCQLQEEITLLKTTDIFNRSLTGSGLNLSCLTDACNDTVTTYGELFQALITKACAP